MNTFETITLLLSNLTLRQLRAVRQWAFANDIFVSPENPGTDELIAIVAECAGEQELNELIFDL